MGEISYKPLIKDMIWSFSRIECFEGCPYRWYLKYIRSMKENDMFYASYGSFIHKIIEMYYRGELPKDKMPSYFLQNYAKSVKGQRPKESTAKKYVNSGCEYLRNFKPFPFDLVGVEKRVEFELDGIPFVGYIDFLGEKDGEYYVVDNKSRDLKPRSKREKPTLKDMELDAMLRQLYIYSEAVYKEYGKYPKALCFNCFKNGEFIVEPFNEKAHKEAVQWAIDSVRKIENEEDFASKEDAFMCTWLCGLHDRCPHAINMNDWRKRKH